jgi:hypothetical protein
LRAGVLYPNDPQVLVVPMKAASTTITEPVRFTKSLQQEIESGDADIEAFGKIIYADIFGANHWVKFCFVTRPSLEIRMRKELTQHEKKCWEYNDSDQD